MFILLITLIAFFAGLVSCEKDLMDYEGENSIYFDVRHGVAWIDSSLWARHYYTGVNFISEPQDTVEVTLQVAVSGQITDYSRPFSVEFVQDSSTAVRGKDFDFQENWEIPAGKECGEVKLYVYRHDYLMDTIRIAVLQVKGNKHFTTRLNFDEDLSGRYKLEDENKKYNPDPRFHTVEMKIEVSKPKGWVGIDYPKSPTVPNPYEAGILGAFTPQKYMLMMKELHVSADFFESMPMTHARTLGEKFAKYLTEQFDAGTPVLEKDGRLMWVMGVKWDSYQYTW